MTYYLGLYSVYGYGVTGLISKIHVPPTVARHRAEIVEPANIQHPDHLQVDV